ncbi:Os01g0617675 [Oryza sativa Japonica Group]|uniref:Os01g0617675 protein n=1 Tax=Oryza sativa subsp. japonica TaxID=39947 RepID=A0A0P0V5B2_ORYSJ|nr:Os01g0617675 [Oryza sativa Japonica Group]
MGGGGRAEGKRSELRQSGRRASTVASERTSTAGGGGGRNGGGGRRRSVAAVGELRRPTQPTTLPKKGRSMATTVVRQTNSEREGPHAELLGDERAVWPPAGRPALDEDDDWLDEHLVGADEVHDVGDVE